MHTQARLVPALLAIAAAATACAHIATDIGAAESALAPRIVITDRGTKQWDRPDAFGPIPAELIEDGQEQCATLNHSGKTFSARGYHARATTADGYVFQDGGFLCGQD